MTVKVPLKCNVIEDVDVNVSESKVPEDQVIVEISRPTTINNRK